MGEEKKKNELAIFGLLCGISSLVLLPFALPAIVLGHIAHRRIKKEPTVYGGKGFATTSLILGYFSVAAAVVLVFWIVPQMKKKMGVSSASSQSATASRIAEGQKPHNFEGTCIDLRAYINAGLSNSVSNPKNVKDNSLSALPVGNHTYGGVPFDTEGIVQLMGRSLLRWGKKYPNAVSAIPIGKACKRIHLFHGASWVKVPGQEIATLTMHFSDGTKQDFNVVAGKHVLDWWGAPQDQDGMADGSRLAWTGTNPYIKRLAPESSLRLYISGFDNPNPDKEITSVDYESRLTDAAPFLLGLTIE